MRYALLLAVVSTVASAQALPPVQSRPELVPYLGSTGDGPAFIVECLNDSGAEVSSRDGRWTESFRLNSEVLKPPTGGTIGSGGSTPIPSGALWKGKIVLRQHSIGSSFVSGAGEVVSQYRILPLSNGRHTFAVQCSGKWSDDVPFYWNATRSPVEQGPGRPLRIGPTSDRLTADDEAQIARIANQQEGRPWLLTGQSLSGIRQAVHPWWVEVFLASDQEPKVVRRGRMLNVKTGLVSIDDFSAPKTWVFDSSEVWAQVPTGTGDPDVVRDSRDHNRPFILRGTFDDHDLRDIAHAVRNVDNAVVGIPQAGPILRMIRDSPSKVSVYLVGSDARELSGSGVVFERRAARWEFVSVFGWAT